MIVKKLFIVTFLTAYFSGFVFAEKELSSSEKRPIHDGIPCVIFSYDRPLQLEAFIRSLYKYVAGMGEVFVIYRSSNAAFDTAFEKVQALYPQVNFIKQDQINPHGCFKKLFLECIFERSKSEYVFFGTGKLLVAYKTLKLY